MVLNNQNVKYEENENETTMGDVIETKSNSIKTNSRFKKENEKKEKKNHRRNAEDFLKEEIVRSVIDEIISKMFNPNRLSRESSSHYLQLTASALGPSSTRLWTEPSVGIGSDISLTSKGGKMKKDKKRSIGSVIGDTNFPIYLSKNKPLLDSRPKFERLSIDTHVTTSSTIISPISASASSKITLLDEGVTDGKPMASPFQLFWCFGFNVEVPIINLTNNESSKILFANSQHGVIYDFHEDTMSFLEGHVNTVSCTASDSSGSLVVTADMGNDVGTSRVIVWDQHSCVLKVLDNVHGYGCQLVGLSSRGEYLVTISAKEVPASIKIWEWERNNGEASTSAVIREVLGTVKKLSMHPSSKHEFAVTCEKYVVFFHLIWQTVFQESVEERVTENIKSCDLVTTTSLPTKLGYLTDTTFLNYCECVALSSTSNGYVIMWNDNVNSRNKKTINKYVRLHLDGITHIQLVDEKIAVASESGNVNFYDLDLKILFFHKLHHEPLESLSFNRVPHLHHNAKCAKHSSCVNTWRRDTKTLLDATLIGEPFSVRHYIVSTKSGRIAYVNASCGTPNYLPILGNEEFTALDVMPNSKYLCAGTVSGKCILIDTDVRKVKLIRQIKVQASMCQAVALLKYSPSGDVLLCAMYTGDIWILDPCILSPVLDSPLTDSRCCVTHMVFSSTSEYLVVTDVSYCVSAYFMGVKPTLLGQYVAHYKNIIEVLIGPYDSNDRFICVFTLSSDRNVCEFNIDRNNMSFVFVRNQRVEQTAIPMHSIEYPPMFTSVCSYIGVNNECKFRFHDPLYTSPANVTRRARGTIQAPDFGSPINFLEIFYVNSHPYLFFKTSHHVGIHLFPIDGNPFRALGYRISPTDIIDSRINCNGKYLFTISENVSGISMWRIDTEAVENFYKSGGEGLEPFLRMLGKEKVEEIRAFFDLGQSNHQGERPDLVRTLKNTLPICEVPYVLQALGCLLTKQDIYELTHELVNVDIQNPTYNFEYDEFVRLYLNRRNSKYLNLEVVRDAFLSLVADIVSEPRSLMTDSTPVIESDIFMQKLLEAGEEMSPDELYADLSILTGIPEGSPVAAYEQQLMFHVPPSMPKEISFKTFVKDILGLSVEETAFRDFLVPNDTE